TACATHSLPGNSCSCHTQDRSRIAKRVRVLESIGFWHGAIFHRNEGVLYHRQGNLVLHFLWSEARSVFLDQEAFDLIICHITCPDDGRITEGAVANPLFLPIENRGI